MQITWLERHVKALDTIINARVDYVREYAEAKERQGLLPARYVYSLGELATRFGLSPGAFSACCHKEPGKSTVALETASALLAAAEHLREVGSYTGFPFHNYRTQRLTKSSEDRDPTTLVIRIGPVAKKMGATIPEAMEAVRRASGLKVSKATVRRWCSNNRPLHIKEASVFKKFLAAIESMRDERDVDTAPARARFDKAFQL